jgi:diphthine synthase
MVEKEKLEAFYGRPVITATRETVELEADEILRDADKVDVAFLVVGDPLGWVQNTPSLRTNLPARPPTPTSSCARTRAASPRRLSTMPRS